jgi:hypothetical protein
MPTLTSKIEHNLGLAEAVKRVKESCSWAHSFSDIKESWFSNTMQFTTSIQGVRISGNIEVTDNALLFKGKVPLVALAFRSWVPNILQNALKQRSPANGTVAADPTVPLVLYLHIPKAGGTTLGEFIYNQCRNNSDNDEGLVRNGVFFTTEGFFRNDETVVTKEMKALLQRNDLTAVIGHFGYGLHEFIERPYQYITILRKPIDRVVSLYHYLQASDHISLQDFIFSSPYREIDNDQTRRIAGVNPEIGKCTAADLEMAKENLRKNFALVGTMERFDESLVLLKQKFGWTKAVSSYPRNVNNHKQETALTAEMMAALENQNKFDIELHRFANQLMDEEIARQGAVFNELLEEQRHLNKI